MTSSGRVAGFGLSTKVGVHFKEDAKTRKERRSKREEEQARKIQQLEAQVAELPAQMEAKMEERLRQLIPSQLWEGLAKWNAAGGVGPIPVPSVSGSNSHQHVSPNMVTPPSNPSAQPLTLVSPQPAAPNTDVQPVKPAPNTLHKPAPLLQDEREQELTQPRVSTLAELDALTQVSVECFIIGSTSHTMNNT